MKVTGAAALCFLASASAFVPATTVRSSTSMAMSAAPESRRDVIQTLFGTAAAAAVALPQLAVADGAASIATVQRAKGIYGGKVIALKDAVKSGNFDAVVAEKNSIKLLSSGGFALSSKEDKAQAKVLYQQIVSAAEKKDSAALQAAYGDLIKLAKLDATVKPGGDTQGYSSEYDWKARTPKGTIYVR